MKFYVSMTWEEWPDHGSYKTIVKVPDIFGEGKAVDCAIERCRWEMARLDGLPNRPMMRDDWHPIDVLPLDIHGRHRFEQEATR